MSKLFDTQQLVRALEQSQADLLASLYADDARMTIVDRDRPPSAPLVIQGRDNIIEFWRDVCGREMTHKVDHMIGGDERVAFIEECLYPDGCRVLSAMTLKLRDGRIVDHLTVQAWDEVSGAPT